MSTSAGVTPRSFPDRVDVDVTEADVEAARQDIDVKRMAVARRRFGITHLTPLIAAGFWLIMLLVANYRQPWPHSFDDFCRRALPLTYLITAITGARLWIETRANAILRPREVGFSDDGVDVALIYTPGPARHYRWDAIRRIDDAGVTFVLVPKRGRRVVLPKRVFGDNGHAMWNVFVAHGIAADAAIDARTANLA